MDLIKTRIITAEEHRNKKTIENEKTESISIRSDSIDLSDC